MTTTALWLDDPHATGCNAVVLAAGPAGIVLDRTVFYARSGGQPGDAGGLAWADGQIPIIEATRGEAGAVLHVPVPDAGPLPAPGTAVAVTLDWARRHRHMRMHTALHLLCSLFPGVYATGNQIGAERSRLDLDLPDPPAAAAVTERLAALIAADHPIGTRWIDEAELDANPALVRTLSVQPPRGAGRIRLVRIGPDAAPIDLQPCGGTHVRSTGEVGPIAITRIENKGRQNRRLHLAFSEG